MKFKPQILWLLTIPLFFSTSVLAVADSYSNKIDFNIVSILFGILGFILVYFIAKTFPKYFFYSLFLLIISGCCPKITTTITETNTIHDTTTIETKVKVFDTIIEMDTLTQVIQLECDSAGKVQIVDNKVAKGKRSEVKTKLVNNTLTNTFICDSLHIVNKYLDSLVRSYRLEKKEKTTINNIVEYRMPFWGWILIGSALSFAFYSRFK
jgi:hypothetical protein